MRDEQHIEIEIVEPPRREASYADGIARGGGPIALRLGTEWPKAKRARKSKKGE